MRTLAITAFLISLLSGCSLIAMAEQTAPEPIKIPRCLEDEVVSKTATCTHPDVAEFRRGYWIAP